MKGKPYGNKNHYKHGRSPIRLYRIWKSMRERCNNPCYSTYYRYGGRGIGICSEWNDFASFRDWALVNGYSDELSIDRINNDEDYSPQNCRWATDREQSNNRRTNLLFTIDGVTKTLAEWSYDSPVKYSTVYSRVKYHGWPIEKALAP